MAVGVEPGLAVEIDGFDDQGIAFKASHRIAEPGRDGALDVRAAVDGEQVKPSVLLEQIGHEIPVLHDLERIRWEGKDALTPGKHTIAFDFKSDGPGLGRGGTGVLTVDGKELASKTIPHTAPFLLTMDETFDVGMDLRTPVDDKDYQVPFRFTGKIAKLTIKLGREQLAESDRKVMHDHLVKAKD